MIFKKDRTNFFNQKRTVMENGTTLDFIKTLDIKKVEDAEALWRETKTEPNGENFKKLTTLFGHNNEFVFSTQECKEFLLLNKGDFFMVSMGILEEKGKQDVIMILKPLDANNQPIKLSSLLMCYYAKLQAPNFAEMDFVEIETMQKKTVTTLDSNLNVLAKTEMVLDPTKNLSYLPTKKAVGYVQRWGYEARSYFFNECDEFHGQRIFNTFSVPKADIVLGVDEDAQEMRVFLGLRDDLLYRRTVPVLIFVSVNKEEGHREVRAGFRVTNTMDFNSPCPPFCGGLDRPIKPPIKP